MCTDEILLHPEPYPSRRAWCVARVAEGERRLAALDPQLPVVLANHHPLVREPTRARRYPEFALWSGTEHIADWHRRFNVARVAYGQHAHPPHDLVRRRAVYGGVRRLPARVGSPQSVYRPVRGATRTKATVVIEDILPPAVIVVEAFDDPPGLSLFPEEEAYVAHAVDSRRREFTIGRHCARTALGRLGVAPTAIPRGHRGAPGWPDDMVGSITHCAGYHSAAVARAADLVAVGIDAEPDEPLPDGVLCVVSLPQERVRLDALAAAVPGVAWDRLLFCAKEAVYKVWSPLTGKFLDFDSVDVVFDPTDDTFVARLLVRGPAVAGTPWEELAGQFLVRDGLVMTAITRGRGSSS